MIVGESERFAIESSISKAYENPGLRALGYFVIHLQGTMYGVRASDATMLACSFDEVVRRLRRRGRHSTFFAEQVSASEIADAVARMRYGEGHIFLGRSREQLEEVFADARAMWAPDGDEAFDDGSCVLQFDVGDRVRVVGFKHIGGGRVDPLSIQDVTLDANDFYSALERWSKLFEAEWSSATKN